MRIGTLHVFPDEFDNQRLVLSSLSKAGSCYEPPIVQPDVSYQLCNGDVRLFVFVYCTTLTQRQACEIARDVVSRTPAVSCAKYSL